jgi:hypothetical protein
MPQTETSGIRGLRQICLQGIIDGECACTYPDEWEYIDDEDDED